MTASKNIILNNNIIPSGINLQIGGHNLIATAGRRSSINNNNMKRTFIITTSSSRAVDPKKMSPLPVTFSPGPFDVICAKGKHAKNHSGNVRFRQMVDRLSHTYGTATNRTQKTILVNQIMEFVRNVHGAFVKYENGQWYQVGETLAREKVGQSLRENNHVMYKSSTKSKRKLRSDMNQKIIQRITTVMSTNDSVAAGLSQLSDSLSKHRKQQQEEDDESDMSSDESDNELEMAMTKANSQILASLKSDRSIQCMLEEDGES